MSSTDVDPRYADDEFLATSLALAAHNFAVKGELGRGTFAVVYSAVCGERCVFRAPFPAAFYTAPHVPTICAQPPPHTHTFRPRPGA